jgi:hypothetical protein
MTLHAPCSIVFARAVETSEHWYQPLGSLPREVEDGVELSQNAAWSVLLRVVWSRLRRAAVCCVGRKGKATSAQVGRGSIEKLDCYMRD